jgi:hypothetical protein
MLAEPITVSGKNIDPPAQPRLRADKEMPQKGKYGVEAEQGQDVSGMTELLAKV